MTVNFKLQVLYATSSRDRVPHLFLIFLICHCNMFSRSQDKDNCSESEIGHARKRKNKNRKKPNQTGKVALVTLILFFCSDNEYTVG